MQDFLPAANTFDWSTFPPAIATAKYATWEQAITGDQLAGRIAVGVDHANDSRNTYLTFLAGALIGLAGGALLSAVQEALHAND
jgi:hypothetical protein